MPTTDPTYGWALPESADPPNGPTQLSALAADIATTFGSVTPYALQAKSGTIGVAIASGSISSAIPQTFQSGLFTYPPVVIFGGSDRRLNFSTTGMTVNGFNLYVRNVADTEAPSGSTVYWLAIQMESTGANGTAGTADA